MIMVDELLPYRKGDFLRCREISGNVAALVGMEMGDCVAAVKKTQVEMRKYPSIDLGKCSECLGCIEIAPQVFRYNVSTGMMEVIDLKKYPEDLVDEAIKNCPEDCIVWEWND